MVVKVYISGISGNKEVKKRQQRVLMILDSKNIKYDVIDITEPGNEADKDLMQNKSTSNGGTVSDPNPRSPLPPQVFNDDEYCGDYDQFDMANEVDTLEQFLKVEAPPEEPPQNEVETNINGEANGKKSEVNSKENSQERESQVVKEETILKEASGKEASSKEGSPEKNDDTTEGGKSKEPSPEPEKPIEDDSVIEKEKSPEKDAETKEKTPEKEKSLNENGTASSRGHSEEKEKMTEVTEHKSDLSEALIQNEKVAAAE